MEVIDILKVKYYGATNTRGARFKVWSNHHHASSVGYDYTAQDAYIAAVKKYCAQKGIKLVEVIDVFRVPGDKDKSSMIAVIKEKYGNET